MFGFGRRSEPAPADVLAYLRRLAPTPEQVAAAMPATHAAMGAMAEPFSAFGGDVAAKYRGDLARLNGPPPSLADFFPQTFRDAQGGLHLAGDLARMIGAPVLGVRAGLDTAWGNARPKSMFGAGPRASQAAGR